ncbi:MAG: pyridoxamine 5'-phosphate oxidase family protein [Armatimonadota bacterium]
MSISENVRNLVDQQPIVALATAALDGTPNVAPIFWKLWYDDSTLLLLDNYMKTTKANIKATGKVSASAWNAESGEGYQLKGAAEYFSEGLHMDAAVAHMEKQKPGTRPKGVVVLRIAEVYVQTPGENAGEPLG